MAQEKSAKVCQACANAENERQMKRSERREDVLRPCKNDKGEKPKEENGQFGTLLTKLRRDEVLLPIRFIH